MALSGDEVDRQIEQMAKFILEEARDKAREIGIKADDDFQRELAKTVQEERQKLLAAQEKRKKAFETKKQIDYSHELNTARLRVLEARGAVVKDVVDTARSRLDTISQNAAKYKQMLQDLITQGLLQLMETNVVVQCRKEDEPIVKDVLPAAVAAYKSKMRVDAIDVQLDREYLPPSAAKAGSGPSCAGGVLLKAAGGRITCDNTLEARLKIAVEQCQPEIRTTLFGASATRKYHD